MSPEQLDWLKASLQEMRHLSQIFVFLHHPRWLPNYKESNWPEVHRALVEAGNVKAVFAGHIHRLNYAGRQEGIEYFALATTGGDMPGHLPQIGYLHHLNILTIRPDSYSMAILPVGSAIDPRHYTPERLQELDRLRNQPIPSAYGPVYLDEQGAVNTEYAARVHNPSSYPIEVTLAVSSDTSGWKVLPDHRHHVIATGATQIIPFRIHRKGIGFDEGFEPPRMSVQIDYLEKDARIALPSRTLEIPVKLSSSMGPAEVSTTNQFVHLDGESCLRVDPDGIQLPAESPFTLEAWVQLSKRQGKRGIIAKSEVSEFALFTLDEGVLFNVHLGKHYVSVKSDAPLTLNDWHHLAGVYDGQEARLYVDGRLADRLAGSGPRTLNRLPLYIGADPSSDGRPHQFFTGKIDEVHLSRRAVYASESFEPVTRHEPDTDTVFLYHLDQALGPFHRDAGPASNHAMRRGDVRLASGDLPVLTTD